MKLRIFGATDKGLVRTQNQDAYCCDANTGIVVLSDGMGGHAAGEIASQMVVEGLADTLAKISESQIEEVPHRIEEAINTVNTKLILKSEEESEYRGMGATVNVLCFSHGLVTIGHVGDSRTYLIRAFKSPENKPRYACWQLTIDHNLGTFMDRGILDISPSVAEGINARQERAKLTRGMGVMPDPNPDIYTKQLCEGDVFLTCSDGLHGFVTDRDVLKTIVTGPIAEAPQRLIEIAKAAGAPDNVTVVLSVISDFEEPLREFAGVIFNARPYLIRLPTGEIQGPFLAAQVIDQWLSDELPETSELASSLGEWVLLRNKDRVTQTYPEFKQESYLNHIRVEKTVPDSNEPPDAFNAKSTKVKSRRKFKKPLLVALAFAVVLALFIAKFVSSELSTVLLPAY